MVNFARRLDAEAFSSRFRGAGRLHDAADITILDITDLSNVRYCFVDFFGMESEREVPLHTPLDRWTYLRACYADDEETVLRSKLVTDGLEKYALVELGALAG